MEPLQQRRRRIRLGEGIAVAGGADLGRDPGGRRRLRHAVVELVGDGGPAPDDLAEVRVGEHVDGTRRRQLLEGAGVLVPHVLDPARVPLGHGELRLGDVEQPRSEPVHAAEEDVERIPGEKGGDPVHAPRVVVDLHAEHDGEAGGLGGEAGLHVRVEVGGHVLVPVARHLVAPALVRLVPPPPSQHGVGLIEAEEVLGQCDLGDTCGHGPLAVGGELVDRGLAGAFAMGPQVQVVVEQLLPPRLSYGWPGATTYRPSWH